MIATWATSRRHVSTGQDLEALIVTLHGLDAPTIVFFEHACGTTLVAGFGGDETVLSFFRQDGASFHSVGDPEREGVIRFRSRDQLDDFLAETAVPSPVAEEAVRLFLVEGNMPDNVEWEADW